jgi:hypothetical protein
MAIGLSSGCAFSTRPPGPAQFVRKVDWRQAPGMKDLAERARKIGDEAYPKILALLVDDVSTAPQQFDIIFMPLRSRNTGQTHLKSGNTKDAKVFINADYFSTNSAGLHWVGRDPANFEFVLVHELAHVAQQCKSTNVPSYWVEGIADFVRFKLGYSNGWHGAECSADSPHYMSGYACAGTFLLFVEAKHGSNIVRQLNKELRHGCYDEAFFARTTGQSLEELWAEFEGTPAFTRAAAKMNKLQKILGYVEGQPPKDLDARFESFVKGLRGGEQTLAALQFMKALGDRGQLPGFSKRRRPIILKGERLGGSFIMPEGADPDAFPVSRTLYCYDELVDSTYYYVMVRTAADSGWELSKAWRTDTEGNIVERYRD